MSSLESLPEQIRRRILNLAIADHEAFASQSVPALGNATIAEALDQADGLERVAEYLAKVEALLAQPRIHEQSTATAMEDELTFTLDRDTAQLLRAALYAVGEHQAAGAPIPPSTREDTEKLGAFLRDLDIALGGPGRFA